ncbi:putative hypothetical protein [Deinococcus grandis]|uniref:Uncharacterized protein n=1 Tax=Deinococcus grandis TaxID=57498 RepID=A0A100HK27_9DEIO|nr:hypothetical protein DEGR_10420 [Deinococcus grandis]GAQ22191.1 putative hypothetical protein [Deinococcus grandis]
MKKRTLVVAATATPSSAAADRDRTVRERAVGARWVMGTLLSRVWAGMGAVCAAGHDRAVITRAGGDMDSG